jgi:hypothetical protein
MSTSETPTVPPCPPAPRRHTKLLTATAIAGLGCLIIYEGNLLFHELVLLRASEASARKVAVVGYVNINPNITFASKPADWFHDEGEHTLLWAAWEKGRHEWFRLGRGDISRDQLSHPLGRDTIQAIDYPILETGGGSHWPKIPDEDLVARVECKGIHAVYPLLVLRKVEVINDLIEDIPLLVTFTPFVPDGEAGRVYDPLLDGKRVTMGLSGYFLDRKPLLYDRGSQSLWVERDGALTAISGARKGATLRELFRLQVLPWSDCKTRHPASRLLVGADRSKGKPEL